MSGGAGVVMTKVRHRHVGIVVARYPKEVQLFGCMSRIQYENMDLKTTILNYYMILNSLYMQSDTNNYGRKTSLLSSSGL